MKPVTYAEVERRLEDVVFQALKMKKGGSQVKFVKQTEAGLRTAIVPKHRQVVPGSLRSILRQAGISEEQWGKL